MYDENLKPSDASKLQVKTDGSCLKQEKVLFTQKNVVSISKAYEINVWAFTVGKDFMLENSLFETIKLVKRTTVFNKYKYSGYWI